MDLAPLFPVAIATVAVIGFATVWYAPRVFGTRWRNEIGPRKDEDDTFAKAMLLATVQYFIILYILAVLLAESERPPYVLAALVAVLGAAVKLGSVVWERRSTTYYLIEAGYFAAAIFIATTILYNWPWA